MVVKIMWREYDSRKHTGPEDTRPKVLYLTLSLINNENLKDSLGFSFLFLKVELEYIFRG